MSEPSFDEVRVLVRVFGREARLGLADSHVVSG